MALILLLLCMAPAGFGSGVNRTIAGIDTDTSAVYHEATSKGYARVILTSISFFVFFNLLSSSISYSTTTKFTLTPTQPLHPQPLHPFTCTTLGTRPPLCTSGRSPTLQTARKLYWPNRKPLLLVFLIQRSTTEITSGHLVAMLE